MRSWPALIVTFPEAGDVPWPDLVSAALDGLDVAAIDEPSDDCWRVCFRSDAARDSAHAKLFQFSLAGLRLEPVEMPEDDWARKSQAALCAIRVGTIVVTPPWDSAALDKDASAITIVIEPGMGFGSGHHPTTRLCLQALQDASPAGRNVLDIGTGSGVLAIAAAKLGARSVVGVDVDPDALESARTNAALNQNPASLAFLSADFRTDQLQPADIVLANLTGAMLAASPLDVLNASKPEGKVILSGITVEESDGVAAEFARHATIAARQEEDGWVSLILQRSPQRY